MVDSSILVDVVPPVAHVSLNRPDALNALTPGMLDDLGAAIQQLDEDSSVDVVVLRGTGRAFCAGVDLKALGNQVIERGAVGDVLDLPARRVIEAIINTDMVVIAAVHGFCFTGALELALACDLIVTTDETKFADTHAKFGLRPSWGMSQRLPRAVGMQRARLLTYTGRTLSGSDAADWGLAAESVPASEFDAAVVAVVEAVTANSRGALRAAKQLYAAAAELGLSEGLVFEAATGFEIDDTEERVASFR